MLESSPNAVHELEDLNVPTLTDYSSRPVRGISAATTFFQHLEGERQVSSPRQRTVSEPNHEDNGVSQDDSPRALSERSSLSK